MSKSKEQAIAEAEKLSKRIRDAKKTAATSRKLEATEQGFQSRDRLGVTLATPAKRVRKRLAAGHSQKSARKKAAAG